MQFLFFNLLITRLISGTAPPGVIMDPPVLLTLLAKAADAAPQHGPVLPPSPGVGSDPSVLRLSTSPPICADLPWPSPRIDQKYPLS